MADLGRMCHLHARNKAGGLQMTLYIDTKPTLEWIEYNGRHMADGYEIKQTPNGRWLLMWTIDNHHYHDTLDHAKAAAQADYEARTAERFRAIDISILLDACGRYELDYLDEAIAKAKIDQ
jgi:hypothetical protein